MKAVYVSEISVSGRAEEGGIYVDVVDGAKVLAFLEYAARPSFHFEYWCKQSPGATLRLRLKDTGNLRSRLERAAERMARVQKTIDGFLREREDDDRSTDNSAGEVVRGDTPAGVASARD